MNPTEKKTPEGAYLLNGEAITADVAHKHLADFYGERKAEVITGLANGRYSCASVKGGVIYHVKKT